MNVQSISVLIPVYNRSVVELVDGLHRQLKVLGAPFEIILMDDKSDDKFIKLNGTISDFQYVHYICLDKNVGRSRIRNLLGEKAQYDQLLFLDCDSGIVDDHFINRYLASVGEVVYGGTSYQEVEPSKDNLLHWRYGRKYEAQEIGVREASPFISFRSNNFMITKATFEQVKFDEKIKEYGHEDTLFAMSLKEKNISIEHTSNPVYHLGLEDNATFIRKTEIALDSLIKIKKTNPSFTTKLWTWKVKVERLWLISSLLIKLGPNIKNWIVKYPNTTIFQLYKLCYLLDVEKDRTDFVSPRP
jgi:glycosyltransferase involved in cell wall biosynthesis